MTGLASTRDQLWQGAVFGGIVNGLMTAHCYSFVNFRRWYGSDYVLDAMDGREGVIVFQHAWRANEGWLVGLFHSNDCVRGSSQSTELNVDSYLDGMPTELWAVATNAIRDCLTWENDGERSSKVTASIWSDGSELKASRAWLETLDGGATLIECELMGYSEEALTRWRHEYAMSDEQFALAVDLHQQRIGSAATIHLTEDYTSRFQSFIADSRSYAASWQLLASMGIFLPTGLREGREDIPDWIKSYKSP